MAGLQRLCKIYGAIDISSDGKTVRWIWDFSQNKARVESEMTKEEKIASEKAKWQHKETA